LANLKSEATMTKQHTGFKIALAVALAAALGLPVPAAARGGDDWGDGHRRDWDRDRGERSWHDRKPRHHHHYRPNYRYDDRRPVVIRQPVYVERPAPVMVPGFGLGNGVTVILRRDW
jgi:hypothetical protein